MTDLTKIILPAEKLEDGSYSKPMTAAQIIEKAKTSTLNRKEMAALRTVGLKKDGSPVAERTAPDANALTAEKLAHAIQLVGVEATFAAAFQRAEGNAEVKGDIVNATRKLLRKLRDDGDETTFGMVVASCARAGVKGIDARLSGGGLPGAGSRADSYAVSKTKRVVVNVADLDLAFDGESCLSRVSCKTIEVDGVKGVFVSLSDDVEASEPAAAGQAALFT